MSARFALAFRHWPLLPLLAAYLWLALGYARETPIWQVPDEPAHYNNVLQRAAPGPPPVIEPGDYPFARLEVLKAARFADLGPDGIRGIEYEDHQPPLYHVLAALILDARAAPIDPTSYDNDDASASVVAERVRLLRRLGIALGALTVVLAWAVAGAVAPVDLALRVGVAAFAAFLPMQLVLNASVNNDPLVFAITAAALLLALRRVAGAAGTAAGWWGALLPGLLIGLAALTKLSALLPVVVVLVAAEWWVSRVGVGGAREEVGSIGPIGRIGHIGHIGPMASSEDLVGLRGLISPIGPIGPIRPIALQSPIGRTLLMVALGLALASPWLAGNISHYGWRDPLALGALHRATACPPGSVALCQPLTADWIARKGLGDLLERGAVFTFESFWGVFGWMGVFLGTVKGVPIYGALAASSLVALVGALALLRRWRRWPERRRAQGLILALHLLMSVGGFVWYNLTFVQHQGRYLLPALMPIALAYCAGLRAAVRAAAGRLGLGARRGRVLGDLVLLAHAGGMAALAWLSLRSYIIPGL